MSYSFAVVGATGDEVISLVDVKLDEVVAAQPVHEADRSIAKEVATKAVELLQGKPDMDVRISVYGSIVTDDAGVRQVSVGVDASLYPREVPAA